jgi:adenylate cyclase
VLVTDIIGFTSFADITEPEYVFETLAEYHRLVAGRVEPLGGEIFDVAGDAVFVVFSAREGGADFCERAVRAALAIGAGGGELVRRWRKRGQDLGLRCALDAGYASIGHVGAGSFSKYAAVGSTVNAVFHLDRAARDGEILATERVADAAAGLAEVVPRPDIELRALTRKVRIFELRLR